MADMMDDGSRQAPDVVTKVKQHLWQAWEADRDNRTDAASDMNFLAGNQWPEEVRQQREAEGRPMLTINRLPQFVRQVTNDIRQSDVAITVVPSDGAVHRAKRVVNPNSPQQQQQQPEQINQLMPGLPGGPQMGHNGGPPMASKPEMTMAEVYNGLIREIQYQSSATHVYATAAEHQVSCGIGWFRFLTDYENDDTFDQCIKIEAINQPLSVYCDPGATQFDRRDAGWIIVTDMLPKETFKERYPKAAEVGIETYDVQQSELYWSSDDDVRIAEYWFKKPIKRTLVEVETEDGGTAAEEWPAGEKVPEGVKSRVVETHEIIQYIVSGSEILEGPTKWAGKHLPFVPVIGSEIPLENKIYRYGLTRFARDPQQLYNFARTSATESMGLAPKSPWLVTAAMIKPFKHLWDSANKSLQPYLPYLPDPKAPGLAPKREAPPDVPVAFVQEAAVADGDIKATIGIYDPQLGQRSNENSGRAIMAREKQGDTGTYHYSDNLRRSLEYAGRILIDLIPQIYDSARTIRILGEDGVEAYVPINLVDLNDDGVPDYVNDMSQGRYDCRVKIGPSYATKRMESADSMMAFMQAFPPAAQLIGDLVADSMDWPGSKAIAERLRRSVPAEVLGEDAPPQQPDPMQELQQQMLMKQLEKLDAEVAKLKADAEKSDAQADKIDAETELMPLDREFEEQRWETDQAHREIDRDDARYKADADQMHRAQELRMRNATNGANGGPAA